MKVTFEDKEYDFDIDEIDVRQAIYLQDFTGLTILGLQQGFAQSDPKALVALYWLMMAQNGKSMDIHKINFKAVKFDLALTEAITADKEARVAAENPTEGETPDDSPPS